MLFHKRSAKELEVADLTNDQTPLTYNYTRSGSPPRLSIIDSKLLITGKLSGDGELQVEGKVDGSIRCSRVVVGKAASVSGIVTADEVVVRGKLKGVVRADRITLQDGAHVESEIFHKDLCIEAGACFEGTSRRSQDPLNAELPDLQANAMQETTSQGQHCESNVGNPIAMEDVGAGTELAHVVHPVAVAGSTSSGDAFAGEMKRLRARLAEWN